MPPPPFDVIWIIAGLAVAFISLIPLLKPRLPRFPRGAFKKKPVSQEPLETLLSVAQLRYEGGDWNANPDSLRNLLEFYQTDHPRAEKSSVRTELFFGLRGRDLSPRRHQFLYATGHADFRMDDEDLQGLLEFAAGGGVILIEDNNGLDFYFREFVLKKLPGYKFEAVKTSPLFHTPFPMPDNRFPKIMKHGNRPAELLRLVNGNEKHDFFYSYSSDLGDGWESPGAHNLRPDKRRLALRMGVNFLDFALRKSRLR